MPNPLLAHLLEQRKRVFYGWWIAIAGAVQDAVKGGTFDEVFLAGALTLPPWKRGFAGDIPQRNSRYDTPSIGIR